MSFPISPVNGQVYKNMIYNSSTLCWKHISECLCGEYRLTASYSHPSGWVRLPFNYKKYSNMNEIFDTSLNRWTMKIPGKYRITLTGYATIVSSGGRYAFSVAKNDSLCGLSGGTYSSAGDSPLSSYNCIVSMNGTTDYIDIRMYSVVAGAMVGSIGEGGHYFVVYIEYLGL